LRDVHTVVISHRPGPEGQVVPLAGFQPPPGEIRPQERPAKAGSRRPAVRTLAQVKIIGKVVPRASKVFPRPYVDPGQERTVWKPRPSKPPLVRIGPRRSMMSRSDFGLCGTQNRPETSASPFRPVGTEPAGTGSARPMRTSDALRFCSAEAEIQWQARGTSWGQAQRGNTVWSKLRKMRAAPFLHTCRGRR
jgi:hypothetical protein